VIELIKHYASHIVNKTILFYKFENHIWQKQYNNVEIRDYISTKMHDIFNDAYVKIQTRQLYNLNNEDGKNLSNMAQLKNIYTTKNKLRKNAYVRILVDEFSARVYRKDFIRRLNRKMQLIAFKNGIYDFNKRKFRPGRPEDYISVQTECDYIGHDLTLWTREHRQMYNQMMEFFNKMFKNREIRDYTIKILSSCLLGNINEQVVYIMNGEGGNGKSKLFQLISSSFGPYYATVDIAIFTERRGSSSGPTPQLEDFQNRRIISSSESDDRDYFNMGILKNMTGGGNIKYRKMYGREMEEVFPQYKLFFEVNRLPKLTSFDQAVYRRFKVIPFETCFIPPPGDDIEEKRKIHKYVEIGDMQVENKIKKWAENGIFLSWLVSVYLKHVDKKSIKVPKIVSGATDKYITNHNYYNNFTNECIKKSDNIGGVVIEISFEKIMKKFKEFIKNRRISGFANTDPDILRRRLLQRYGSDNFHNNILYGYEFKLD